MESNADYDDGHLQAHPHEDAAPDAPATPDEVARRDFLIALAAGVAAVAAEGCQRAPEGQAIVPYVDAPPEVTPGVPTYYATAMALNGYGVGLVAESHEGRPTKIEGNPDHPASLGATGAQEQAMVLGVYDPSRSHAITRAVTGRREEVPLRALLDLLAAVRTRGGRGLHVVLEPTASPTVAAQIARMRAALPAVQVHFFSALPRSNVWEGARLALGAVGEPRIDLRDVDVILSLDADFAAEGPARLPLARQLAARRRVESPSDTMARLYVAEPTPTPTGLIADHRLRIRSQGIAALAAALLAEVAATGGGVGDAARARVAAFRSLAGPNDAWVREVAKDLLAHRGRGVVVVGDAQPPLVHAIGWALNAALGNVGAAVSLADSPILEAGQASHDPRALAKALDAGEVDTLVVAGANLAYGAPADLDFAAKIPRARASLYLGAYEDETARVCAWHVPEAHVLSSWGDVRAFDGTASIVQPLIAKAGDEMTIAELLAAVAGGGAPDARALVEATWRASAQAGGDFDTFFRGALARGTIDGTKAPTRPANVDWAAIAALTPPPEDDTIEIAFRPDARVYDGRFTNNAWLLEMPEPTTKLTWENALLVARVTAARLGIDTGDVVDVAVGDRSVRAPVLVHTGQAERSLALTLGWGREGAEVLGRGLGVAASRLRTTTALFAASGARVTKVGGDRHGFARTQGHFRLDGREDSILVAKSLDDYRKEPEFAKPHAEAPRRLYMLAPHAEKQWGMVIDLAACTGCSACVVACQVENNVPVVGKAGVDKGREMHWLRIDRYELGSEGEPEAYAMPMLCQHCEKAPCEYVCPVNATTHSQDGLNQMVYNRCVGTRFCSNNCPYKVRRFNWFNYQNTDTSIPPPVMNPDVTVRERGVMEKCTYCVQRIREAEIDARVKGAKLEDGAVKTACQQACPTAAIVFGDIADASTAVARAARNERVYAVLNDLGTLPRTRYLAPIRNPNPALAKVAGGSAAQ